MVLKITVLVIMRVKGIARSILNFNAIVVIVEKKKKKYDTLSYFSKVVYLNIFPSISMAPFGPPALESISSIIVPSPLVT